jgi:hypothetical protein
VEFSSFTSTSTGVPSIVPGQRFVGFSEYLAIFAAIHGKSIDQVNALWNQCASSGEASLGVVQASLISGRPIEEINYLISQMSTWGSEGGSLLVLTRMAEEQGAGS